jgi:hypothetical protein
LYLVQHNLLEALSEETSNFLAEHPDIVREEFGIPFERDPFDFRDSNVLFYCPINRIVSNIQPSTPSPSYSSDSDSSLDTVTMVADNLSKTKKNAKKVEDESNDNEHQDDDSQNNDDTGSQDSPDDTLSEEEDPDQKAANMCQTYLRLDWKIASLSIMN